MIATLWTLYRQVSVAKNIISTDMVLAMLTCYYYFAEYCSVYSNCYPDNTTTTSSSSSSTTTTTTTTTTSSPVPEPDPMSDDIILGVGKTLMVQ